MRAVLWSCLGNDEGTMTVDAERLERAIAGFDAFNGKDPNTETFEGEEHPKELLYAKRMTGWLEKLAPDASDAE